MGRSDLDRLQSRRILIHANGSHAIGLGHIFRMRSLANALQKAGSHVAFLTLADPIATALLESCGLPCYIFQPDAYEMVRQDAIREFRPDVILQDVLETSLPDMTGIRRAFDGKIINLDDVGAGLLMADAVVNSMVFHWGKYSSKDCKARLFEGPQYMILHPDISHYTQCTKRIAAQADKILLTFGGTDTYYIAQRVLQAVNLVPGSLEVTVNIGPGSKNTPELEEAVRSSRHQVRVLHAIPDLFAEFYRADVVICAAGTMLYELAAMGVPSISIPSELHEIPNAAYWAGIGTTLALDWERHLNSTQVVDAVEILLPAHQRRLAMSTAGKRAMDVSGLERVMKVIDEVLS